MKMTISVQFLEVDRGHLVPAAPPGLAAATITRSQGIAKGSFMAGERILVAEDDPVTARFLHSLLTGKGYDVLVAEDGEQAFEMALEYSPDLIVSDLVMPYRDGFNILGALRSDRRLSSIPVVIVSMRDREEDIVRGFEDGADDYVVKPFNARELLARVRKLLSRP